MIFEAAVQYAVQEVGDFWIVVKYPSPLNIFVKLFNIPGSGNILQ